MISLEKKKRKDWIENLKSTHSFKYEFEYTSIFIYIRINENYTIPFIAIFDGYCSIIRSFVTSHMFLMHLGINYVDTSAIATAHIFGAFFRLFAMEVNHLAFVWVRLPIFSSPSHNSTALFIHPMFFYSLFLSSIRLWKQSFMLITPPRHHLVIYMLLYPHLLRLLIVFFSLPMLWLLVSVESFKAIADFGCCQTTYKCNVYYIDPDGINTEITCIHVRYVYANQLKWVRKLRFRLWIDFELREGHLQRM